MQGTFAGLCRMRLCQLLFDKKMRVFVADGEDFDARLTQLDSTWNTGARFWLERSLPPYLKCPQSIIYRCWKSDPHWFLLAQRVIASIRYDTLLRETRGVPAFRQAPQTLHKIRKMYELRWKWNRTLKVDVWWWPPLQTSWRHAQHKTR